MKTIFTVIFFVSGVMIAKAQSFEDHFYSSYGFGLDFGAGSVQVYSPVYSSGMFDSACFAYQNSYSGISFAYEARYNLFQPSDNLAISLKSKPAFTILFQAGLAGAFIPIGVGLETGNGSTYKSESDVGFTFTAGYSFNFNPLFKAGYIYDVAKTYKVDLKTNWGSPYIAAGIRYWSKFNKLREINILYGFGGGTNDELPANAKLLKIESNLDDGKSFNSYMLSISWMMYINY